MRFKVVSSTAVLASLACFASAPAANAQACEFPKGHYTSQAEFQYATSLYFGKLQESLRGSGTNLTTGNLNRTVAYLSAVQRYAQALPANLPRC